MVDAFGMLPGHQLSQSDAVQAYLQTQFRVLGGDTVTWVRLPREFWPKEWYGKYRDPVCPLVFALHGHPDRGGLWEIHCEEAVKQTGRAC